jgi:hypothetical protein
MPSTPSSGKGVIKTEARHESTHEPEQQDDWVVD